MKLLTEEIRAAMPKLYELEGKFANVDDAPVTAKFFLPGTGWTWYAMEANAELNNGASVPLRETGHYVQPELGIEIEEVRFFGYVVGFEGELGYFHLSELLELRSKMGLKVERDRYWKPGTPLREAKRQHAV